MRTLPEIQTDLEAVEAALRARPLSRYFRDVGPAPKRSPSIWERLVRFWAYRPETPGQRLDRW